MPPRTLYCIKYQLAGVYLVSAIPHRLICIHSHHKLHSGDTNYIKHAQIRYVYAIKHSLSGAMCSCFIAYTYLLSMLYLIHVRHRSWESCVVLLCLSIVLCCLAFLSFWMIKSCIYLGWCLESLLVLLPRYSPLY